MERGLLWGAMALGCAGALCGLLLSRGERGGSEEPDGVTRPLLLLAALLPALAFLVTLPAGPPFGGGHGWGRGFLLGGVGALLAGWVLPRLGRAAPAASVAAGFSLALVVVAVPLLGMRAVIIDALAGVAMGWLAVSLVLYVGLPAPGPRALALAAGAGFAVTLCAAAALGVYREPLTPAIPKGTWSALAVAFAAAVPFALLLAALPARLPGRALPPLPARLLLTPLLPAGLAMLLSARVIAEPRLFLVSVLGLLLGPVAWWVLRDAASRKGPTPNPASPIGLPPLAVLLVASAFMVAYQLLQGFGVGLLLVGAWLTAGTLLGQGKGDGEEARAGEAAAGEAASARGLVCLLLFGVVLLLYRLFASRWAEPLRGVTLTDHYALFGFITGAVLPTLLGGVLSSSPLSQDWERGAGGVRAGALALAGVIALAVPGVILALWGAKCALALLAGLALGGVQAFGARDGEAPGRHLLPPLLAVGVALALAQWTGHVLPLSEMTRAEKIRVLVIVVGCLGALVVALDYGGRLRGRTRGPGDAVVPAREGVTS